MNLSHVQNLAVDILGPSLFVKINRIFKDNYFKCTVLSENKDRM